MVQTVNAPPISAAAEYPRTRRRPTSTGRWALLFCALAVMDAADAPRAAEADKAASGENARVFVPSYWDPSQPPDKPSLESPPAIHFVTEDDNPPFGFTAADGTLIGFDVDLARAICRELKVSCTIQVRRYDTIVPALRAGAADAAVASMAITPQALENVDFTSPYYKTPARFAARRASGFGDVLPETIGGKRVGVERGTAHEAFLVSFFAGASIQPFGSAADVRTALASGAVDLAFGDGIALAQWLQAPASADCCVLVGGPFTESRYFGEGAGIAVRKGNGALRQALDYALARLAAEGTYADLYLKYFPIGAY